jgi:hypothetical protein
MSDCTELSDRMPSVVLGRAEWTAAELQHLGGCSSCRREWELLRATSRLGETAAAALDTAPLAPAVLHRLSWTRKSARKRKVWGVAGLATAAALAGVLWTGRSDQLQPGSTPTPIVAGLQIPLPELDELQPAELDSVLQGMDRAAPDIDTLQTTDPGALDAPELETIYDYWEG